MSIPKLKDLLIEKDYNKPPRKVGAVAVVSEGQVLCVKRSETQGKYPNFWSLPMGGVEKAVATATFGLKQVTKLMMKRSANKAAKEAAEKVAKEGTEAAVKAAVKTIAKVPIAKSTGLPDARSTKAATNVLKKEVGEDATNKILKTVAKEGGEQALETGSKLLVRILEKGDVL